MTATQTARVPRLVTSRRRRSPMLVASSPAPATARRAICALATLLALTSCGIVPKPLPTPRRVIEAEEPANPFAPVGVKVHPLTRLVPGNKANPAPTIDAHIELIDHVGDSVKGAGLLTIELYRGTGPVSAVGEQDQVRRWTLNLSDPETNRLAYDRVTRTYRVTLTGIPDSVVGRGGVGGEGGGGERLTLRARVTTTGGRQFSGEARLGW